MLLPSAHLRWNLSDADRLSLSRRTYRAAPELQLPAAADARGREFGDNDFVGNPALEPETRLGPGPGLRTPSRPPGHRRRQPVLPRRQRPDRSGEHRRTQASRRSAISRTTSRSSSTTSAAPTRDAGYPQFDPDSFLFTAANVGDGSVYGIEFDVSHAADVARPAEHRRVRQLFLARQRGRGRLRIRRRFNDQARYVLQRRLHPGPAGTGAPRSAPATASRATPISRVLAEEVPTTLRRGPRGLRREALRREASSLRLTGSNLLDASKDEIVRQVRHVRRPARSRLRRIRSSRPRRAGPVYQLVARYAF